MKHRIIETDYGTYRVEKKACPVAGSFIEVYEVNTNQNVNELNYVGDSDDTDLTKMTPEDVMKIIRRNHYLARWF